LPRNGKRLDASSGAGIRQQILSKKISVVCGRRGIGGVDGGWLIVDGGRRGGAGKKHRTSNGEEGEFQIGNFTFQRSYPDWAIGEKPVLALTAENAQNAKSYPDGVLPSRGNVQKRQQKVEGKMARSGECWRGYWATDMALRWSFAGPSRGLFPSF
jgi:hypothetical protein